MIIIVQYKHAGAYGVVQYTRSLDYLWARPVKPDKRFIIDLPAMVILIPDKVYASAAETINFNAILKIVAVTKNTVGTVTKLQVKKKERPIVQ